LEYNQAIPVTQQIFEGNLIVQPGSDYDGDGEWWLVNSDGDTALIDMDHNPRSFYVQHQKNSLLWLTSWNGWRGNTHVNGNLFVRQHAFGYTLFSAVTDSANNTLSLTAGGEIGIKKWLGGVFLSATELLYF